MKYVNETIINLPVDRVVALFDDPDNLKHWQPGLQSFEHLSGTRGQPGARSRLRYKMGKREIEMIETIDVRNLPHEFSGTYEMKGVLNKIKNRFIPLEGGKTRYIAENDFRFRGFMKIIALLMPGVFEKQSQKLMDDFKTFAESKG